MTQEQKAPANDIVTRKDIVTSLGKALKDVLAKHEKNIKSIEVREAKGNEKLTKAASGCAGELPQNTYNQPGVVLKADLPGAGTGVTNDDPGAWGQSMKMGEKCPSCSSTNTGVGPQGSDHLACRDCSKLFRGKSMKKVESNPNWGELSCPACEGPRVEHLGDLGSRSHFICKGCGMSFSHKAQTLNDRDLEPVAKKDSLKVAGKSVADIRKAALSFNKKTIPAVEPATDETSAEGAVLPKDKKSKVVEANGSGGEPTTGPDLEKKGLSPEAGKAIATKKSEITDPGSTSNELGKTGLCPTCGSHLATATSTCKECNHPRLAEGLRSQVAEKDRKAAIKANIAQWDRENEGKGGFQKQMLGTTPAPQQGAVGVMGKSATESASTGPSLSRSPQVPVTAKTSRWSKEKGGDLAHLCSNWTKNKGGFKKQMLGTTPAPQQGAVGVMGKSAKGIEKSEMKKAGIYLQKPVPGSSVSNYKVLPRSNLPPTSQIPQTDRTSFLKGVIARHHAGMAKAELSGRSPTKICKCPLCVTGRNKFSNESKAKQTAASNSTGNAYAKAELAKPKTEKRKIDEFKQKPDFLAWKAAREAEANKKVGKAELAKVAPPGEEKLVHKLKDEYGHDKAGKEKAFATAWAIHNKTVNKAEASGLPKAPSAGAIKMPGVKPSNPTAPKPVSITPKSPTVPKV